MDVERFQRTKFTDRKHNPFTEPASAGAGANTCFSGGGAQSGIWT